MSTIFSALAVVAASSGLLVSPSELAAMIKDPAVVVVAVGTNPADFELGHVPGARFVDYGDIAIDTGGLSSELPPIDQLRRVLANAGISDRSKVIIYGSTIAATRMFFTLDYFGHPSARVLNGGLSAWKEFGGAIEEGPARSFGRGPDAQAATRSRCVRGLDQGRLSSPTSTSSGSPQQSRGAKMTLLDARPDAEFTGADGGMNGVHVKGHLPDAQQLVWNTLLDSSGRFLPDAELKKNTTRLAPPKARRS